MTIHVASPTKKAEKEKVGYGMRTARKINIATETDRGLSRTANREGRNKNTGGNNTE